MMPRPLQESNVVNKAGTAGFLGRAFDPYYICFRQATIRTCRRWTRSASTIWTLRPEVSEARLDRRLPA